MTSAFAVKLGFLLQSINIGMQKINGSISKMYSMIIVAFLIQDQLDRIWFFEETFWLADISIKIVLKMFFLTFTNKSILDNAKSFTWRFYNLAKVLPIAKQVGLIDKHKFAKIVFHKNLKRFVGYIAALKAFKLVIYLFLNFLLAAL